MTYRVAIFCPDQHIPYDGTTPEEHGIGGGITARVRMGRALASQGHQVKMLVNCPARSEHDGVEYIPLSESPGPAPEVLIVTTSGGAYDVSAARDLDWNPRFTALWVHGLDEPGGWKDLSVDAVYAVSNFVCDGIHKDWLPDGFPALVTYNGLDDAAFRQEESDPPVRDPFELVYLSHPSKGLDAARALVRRLRTVDERFHLVVFGGESLWGQADEPRAGEPGIQYAGRIGQRRLARELMAAGFAVALQSRLEPFGFAVTEAMRGGCVVLASPVGAHPELIHDGVDGLLIGGDPNSPTALGSAVERILACLRDPSMTAGLRAAARRVPWTADLAARTWTGHWDQVLDPRGAIVSTGTCPRCGSPTTELADGEHCTGCGRFQQRSRTLDVPRHQQPMSEPNTSVE